MAERPSVEEVLKQLSKYGNVSGIDRDKLADSIRATLRKNPNLDPRLPNGDLDPGFSTAVLQTYQGGGGLGIGAGGNLGADVGGTGSTGGGGGGGGDTSPWGDPDTGGKGDDSSGLTEHQKEMRQRRREERNFNQEQGFIASLAGYGLKLSPNLQALVTEAQRKNWTSSTFLNFLRKTPEYRQRFPGIFNKDGTLKMSETQYIRYEASYKGIAASAGINLGPQKLADLFRTDTSVEEFRTKSAAIARVQTDPALRRQLEAVAGENLTRRNVYEFVIGEGNEQWYRDWNKAIARNAAVQAGIELGKKAEGYTAVSPRLIEKYGLKGLDEATLATGFEKIADTLLESIPDSMVQSMGLSKKEVVRSVLGGKDSAQARALIKRIQETATAFDEEDRGTANLDRGPTGGIGQRGNLGGRY